MEKKKFNINEVLGAVDNFRRTWCTTNGRILSLNSALGSEATLIAAYNCSYAPSTQRALVNPQRINTMLIRENLKKDFINALKIFLNANKTFNFEQWERDLAKHIRTQFIDAGMTDYTYGNAQKWINMSIKYLFSSKNFDPLLPCFKLCYIPIDRDVQRKAHEILGIDYLFVNGKRTNCLPSWSNCDCMDDIVDFENRIRVATDQLGYYSPLMWEIENWNR